MKEYLFKTNYMHKINIDQTSIFCALHTRAINLLTTELSCRKCSKFYLKEAMQLNKIKRNQM